jgi:hypothetical protein
VTHVETRGQVGLDDFVPLLKSHLVHGAVAGDTGVVDQYLDRPDIAFDLRHRRLAGIVIADVELVDRNVVGLAELIGLFIVAGIGCDDLVAGFFQCQANGFANASRTTCYQSYSAHFNIPPLVVS